jgi:hypothetical protein
MKETPQIHDRRAPANASGKEQPEFKRLKLLAYALGIRRVTVSPASAIPHLQGFFCQGSEVHSQFLREWGLSCSQIRSITRKDGTVLLIDYEACFDAGACRTLSHEIGHHIFERLAGLTEHEINLPVSKHMCSFFPSDPYVQENRSEICAECFAEYLTNCPVKPEVEHHCVSILRRIHLQNPNAAKLIHLHRETKTPPARDAKLGTRSLAR